MHIAFGGDEGLILRANGLLASSATVTNRFAVERHVSYECLGEVSLNAWVNVTVQNFAPFMLHFRVPCNEKPHFEEHDAELVARRFVKNFLSQPMFAPYVDRVGVEQLRDIPSAKLGRDDDYDDWAVIAYLNYTPPTRVHNVLPTFFSGLHVFYEIDEECEPDYTLCYDGSKSPRILPKCRFVPCPPNPHTKLWVLLAFGLSAIACALIGLVCFLYRTRDRQRSQRTALQQEQQAAGTRLRSIVHKLDELGKRAKKSRDDRKRRKKRRHKKANV